MIQSVPADRQWCRYYCTFFGRSGTTQTPAKNQENQKIDCILISYPLGLFY